MRKGLLAVAIAASLSGRIAILVLLIAINAQFAYGSDWDGGNGNWNSNVSPGWNGTGVPNAVGATANDGVAIDTTTTQNVAGGQTVGTISLTNNSNNRWTITNTNGITLDQVSPGTGTATISNTNTDTGTNQLPVSDRTLHLRWRTTC